MGVSCFTEFSFLTLLEGHAYWRVSILDVIAKYFDLIVLTNSKYGRAASEGDANPVVITTWSHAFIIIATHDLACSVF
jgi:hypothetical protein